MAAIAFFIIFLTLSSTIHARESHFFNKFSNKPTLDTNQQQKQPDFIPQTQDSGSYGLYPQEYSGHLPPSTTTTTHLPANLPENYNPVAYTTPIHSSTQDIPDEFKEDPPTYKYNSESREYNSHDQDHDDQYFKGGYNSEMQGFDDARFMETGNTAYNSRKRGRYYNQGSWGESTTNSNSNNNMYNSEKQGMSDTRFLENGKYFYDVNMENHLNSNANINTQGGYYDQRAYDRYNSNFNGGGGYQNQNQEEEDQFNP
ncbi:hypothetical protein SSX86_027000 [Deinandra increscens subsp. villosa]|uniref:Protein E6-like n=1 Tax=Deinandra increscens subsp. villosa TaxID=3103831 RepID=A0AAP0CM77_9ASTR